MPRIRPRTYTIEHHKSEVRAVILAAAAELVAERGVTDITPTRIAKRAGIGRAALYRYFPDVETILATWYAQKRRKARSRLSEIIDGEGPEMHGLRAALHACALAEFEDPLRDMAVCLRGSRVAALAERELRHGFATLLEVAVNARYVRDDVDEKELARFCVQAVGAAANASSTAEVTRIVELILDAIRRRPKRKRKSVRAG
jgi:AcrR family transcriptional regulator